MTKVDKVIQWLLVTNRLIYISWYPPFSVKFAESFVCSTNILFNFVFNVNFYFRTYYHIRKDIVPCGIPIGTFY